MSSFAFDYLLTYLHSRGGMLEVRTDCEAFRHERLIEEFGPSVPFGHLELFVRDPCLVYLSHQPENWHHGSVHVEIRTATLIENLPKSVRQLIPYAHVISQKLKE